MPQRRFHTKSRQGCVQCKKNRTKCDEDKPKCGRCQRVGLECSLTDPNCHIIFVAAKTAKTGNDRTDCSSIDGGPDSYSISSENILESPEYLQSMMPSSNSEHSAMEPHFSDMERERLNLMCHYTLHASNSLAEITIPEDQDQSLWSTWVTDLALGCDFLLHGVLSLSALHLALCGISRQKNILLAIKHHDLGVALFRPHLSNIIAGNYYAMIAFSCVVAFYALGIQRFSQADESSIEKLQQVLTLIRASSVIIKADYEAVLQSPWSVTMTHIPNKPLQNLSYDVKDMISTLQNRVSMIAMGTSKKNVYSSTIEALREGLEFAQTYLFTQKTITSFVLTCPAEFWKMISAREPLALAILANYAVILHWQRNNIWMKGWGKDVVNDVYIVIPIEWHDCIFWARRQTELV